MKVQALGNKPGACSIRTFLTSVVDLASKYNLCITSKHDFMINPKIITGECIQRNVHSSIVKGTKLPPQCNTQNNVRHSSWLQSSPHSVSHPVVAVHREDIKILHCIILNVSLTHSFPPGTSRIECETDTVYRNLRGWSRPHINPDGNFYYSPAPHSQTLLTRHNILFSDESQFFRIRYCVFLDLDERVEFATLTFAPRLLPPSNLCHRPCPYYRPFPCGIRWSTGDRARMLHAARFTYPFRGNAPAADLGKKN